MSSEGTAEIRSLPASACTLCGDSGALLHVDQRDRLFEAPGVWSFRRCRARDCGLMWLDPMPVAEDLGIAYGRYYTHQSDSRPTPRRGARAAYARIKRSYLADAYGYRLSAETAFAPIVNKLMYLLPLRRHELDTWIRSLRSRPNGHLLDVGCGSGDWLAALEELGWNTHGTDADEAAVRTARERGLDVYHGALEQRAFPDECFDAITLNHVIEHVPNPRETVAECRRILKQGGMLAISTPNVDSLSHRYFGADWRGLEPPRHLHVFSKPSLNRILGLAGFSNVTQHAGVATSVLFESVALRRGWRRVEGLEVSRRAAYVACRGLSAVELGLSVLNPSWADCIRAFAVKR